MSEGNRDESTLADHVTIHNYSRGGVKIKGHGVHTLSTASLPTETNVDMNKPELKIHAGLLPSKSKGILSARGNYAGLKKVTQVSDIQMNVKDSNELQKHSLSV